MAGPIPSRSSQGCLTCKRRKKKCDEKRPRCQRCLLGGFDCLGYAHLEGYSSQSTSNYRLVVSETTTSNAISFPYLPDGTSQPSMGVAILPGGTLLPLVNHRGTQTQYNGVPLPHPNKYSASIPRSPQLGAFERNNMIDLITSQYARVADRALFRPFPYVFKEVVAARAQKSDIILKTMYLGARICQALLDDTREHIYVGWIDSFRHQISGTQPPVGECDVAGLADRLSAHHELSFFAFMLVNNPIGYSLLRAGVPLFLQLAAEYPQVWTQDSAISISHALNPKRHEMARFVLADTISALAFGTAPLLNYDTTIHENELEYQLGSFLEQVYSCPVILLILLARVNSARMTRLVNQRGPTSSDIREVEDRIRGWSPTLDYADRPFEFITRLAVQECWRQATLIYVYMGMCGVNSADERVQSLVSQVAHLASTIEAGSPFEAHICVPCLIAGVAARKENHRATFRRKILASQKADTRLLRGADFVFVLDHLWHGVAAGGNPVTWEDYVNSRYITMPVDV